LLLQTLVAGVLLAAAAGGDSNLGGPALNLGVPGAVDEDEAGDVAVGHTVVVALEVRQGITLALLGVGVAAEIAALGHDDPLFLGPDDVAVVAFPVQVVVSPHLVDHVGPHGAQVLAVHRACRGPWLVIGLVLVVVAALGGVEEHLGEGVVLQSNVHLARGVDKVLSSLHAQVNAPCPLQFVQLGGVGDPVACPLLRGSGALVEAAQETVGSSAAAAKGGCDVTDDEEEDDGRPSFEESHICRGKLGVKHPKTKVVKTIRETYSSEKLKSS